MKYLKLLRVKHYVKNFLIFLPVIFGMKIFDVSLDLRMLLGVASFSLMASVIYILNDIKDIEKDRRHPKKKFRPIASGVVSVREARITAVILFVLSIALNWVSLRYVGDKRWGWLLLMGYLLINVVYSLFDGKSVPLLDVVLLMSGFVIRVYYGSAISEVPVSTWMCLVICSGAFYMGFGKRRNELNEHSEGTRTVLKYYTKEFLDHVMNCCMTLSITFYALWVLTMVQEENSTKYVWSIPILMVLMFKYSMDVENPENKGGGDPVEVIFSDWSLILLALIFVLYLGVCLYLL